MQFMLCEKGDFARIPFNPSVFRGTGEEARMDICFELSLEQVEWFKAFENYVRSLIPGKYNTWNSALRVSEKYPPHLKVKINVREPHKAQLFDERAESVDFPETLRDRFANPVITVTDIYNVNGAAGLWLNLSYMQLKDVEPACNPFK
jgi:hypothetical protein